MSSMLSVLGGMQVAKSETAVVSPFTLPGGVTLRIVE